MKTTVQQKSNQTYTSLKMVSLEALAMAGTNGVECSMDFEEWELNDLEQYPPPHLLAQEEEDDDNNNKSSINGAIKELGKEDYGVIVTNHEEKWNTTFINTII
jgi:hypothetical protein